MTFSVALTRPAGPVPVGPSGEPVDSFISLVIDACDLLSRAGYGFAVSGFGDPAWPVDVRYDLATVVEQFPDLIRALRGGADAMLDFYGQGVERLLEFVTDGTSVEIHCWSGTVWRPNPAVERADLDELVAMFTALAVDVARALAQVSPVLAGTHPIPAWLTGDIRGGED